jgi:hypothetical protein
MINPKGREKIKVSINISTVIVNPFPNSNNIKAIFIKVPPKILFP